MLLTLLPAMAFATDEVDAEPQPSIMERVRAVIATVGVGIQPLGTVTHTGTIGAGGAPWRLYDNGTVIVDSGHINWTMTGTGPWNAHRLAINQIVFQGTHTLGPSLRNLFGASSTTSNLPNLTSVVGIDNWDLSNVTDMSSMFNNATSLTSVGDLSNWDTSGVTNMGQMFAYTTSLPFVGDLSNWDVSGVTTMHGLFDWATSLTSVGDLSNWDVSNVVIMENMFQHVGFTDVGDLSNWDISNVTMMAGMFSGTKFASLDLSNWPLGNVTRMGHLFNSSQNLVSLNLANWDTSNVTDLGGSGSLTGMRNMFGFTTSLRELTLGPNFNFVGGTAAALLPVPNNADFTGYWQNVGTGTTSNPQGAFTFTSDELMTNYNGAIHADTWVWQPRNPTVPAVHVGAQTGAMIPGQAGTATFPVITANIPNGNYTVTVANLPGGVTVQGQVTITSGSGILTLAGNTLTLAGVTNNLILTLNGVTSNAFTLTIAVPRIIELNRGGVEVPFPPQSVGYSPADFRFSTIVQNISPAATGGLTVTISGPNASAFEITHISRPASVGVYQRLPNAASTLAIPSLAVGGTANLDASRRFMIQPVAGLTAGTHTARVTVSVDSDLTNQFDEYFDIEFVVQ